uniref:Uncharacterized protein n=1 Tax=Zea mays TaxID=4577 RepID=A0A804UED6_MAIZE
MTSLNARKSVERFIDTHGPDALDRIIRVIQGFEDEPPLWRRLASPGRWSPLAPCSTARSRGFEDELDEGFCSYSPEDTVTSTWDNDVYDAGIFLFTFGDNTCGPPDLTHCTTRPFRSSDD